MHPKFKEVSKKQPDVAGVSLQCLKSTLIEKIILLLKILL